MLFIRNAAIVAAVALAFAGCLGLLPVALPWRRWSKGATLVAAVAQIGIAGVGFRRKRDPSAFVLPLIAVACSAAWFAVPGARFVVIAGPIVDVALVAILVGSAMRTYRRDGAFFEESFERLLRRFFSSEGTLLAARVTALDFGGIAYLLGGWKKRPPAGISYHRNNATLVLIALAGFAAIPELLVVELFIGTEPFVWHALNVVAHAYIVFWFVAVYASFRDRPHSVTRDALIVRRGLFNTIRIPWANIERVEATLALSRKERRALGSSAVDLRVFESALLRLSLNLPCALENFFGKHRMVSIVFLPVDDSQKALETIDRLRIANCETFARRSD